MKTPALASLQSAFHDHLLDLPSAIAREVAENGRISVDHRLGIYHNAYRARLLEALQDAFEKTWAYLGDDVFESAVRAFIEENPPHDRNLRWYGEGFPQWLATRCPEDPDVAELAMIDWQLRRAFDGPNAMPMQAAELAKLQPAQWETVGFRFVPTLFMAPLRHNIVGIWHALDQEQTPPDAALLPESAWLLIWRKGWQPHFRTLHAAEHSALSQLHAGASFAQVCANLSRQFSEEAAASVAAQSLHTWLQDELLVKLTFPAVTTG